MDGAGGGGGVGVEHPVPEEEQEFVSGLGEDVGRGGTVVEEDHLGEEGARGRVASGP